MTTHAEPLDDVSAYLCNRITKEQASSATVMAQSLALQVHKTLAPLLDARAITGTQSLATMWFTALALMSVVTTAIRTLDAKTSLDS